MLNFVKICKIIEIKFKQISTIIIYLLGINYNLLGWETMASISYYYTRRYFRCWDRDVPLNIFGLSPWLLQQ